MKYLHILLITLSGCASLDNAGTASYRVKPMELSNGTTICCDITVNNGKEFAKLEAHIIKHGDDYEVHLNEVGVSAFRGQEIAAGAAKEAAADVVKAAMVGGAVLVAPIAAPAIGAVIGSGTLPALAVGAATTKAVVDTQK